LRYLIIQKKNDLEGNSPNDFYITIYGPQGTPYEGGKWELHVQFPIEYPFKPWHARLHPFIWNPYVNSEGKLHTTFFDQSRWSPQVKLREVIEAFYQKLVHPEPTSNMCDNQVIKHYKENLQQFENKARDCTRYYAQVRQQVRMLYLVHLRCTTPSVEQPDPPLPQLPAEMLFRIANILIEMSISPGDRRCVACNRVNGKDVPLRRPVGLLPK